MRALLPRSTVRMPVACLAAWWMAAASVAHAAGPAGDWGQWPGRSLSQAIAVFDSLRDRVVMVTGAETFGLSLIPQVLTFPAVGGVPETLAVEGEGPTPRIGCAGVYDPVGDRIVLFGGNDYRAGSNTGANDVWELTLSGMPRWRRLSPAGAAPQIRYGHVAVYDPARHRMILTSGMNYLDHYLTDTWELSLGETLAWHSIATTGTPPPGRLNACAIWDAMRERLVFYGGRTSRYCHHPPKAIYVLDLRVGAHWSVLSEGTAAPGPHEYPSATYDGKRDRMLVVGGLIPCDGSTPVTTPMDSTLAIDLATGQWSVLGEAGVKPSPRAASQVVLDTRRDRLVVHGGSDNRDVWALDLTPGATWSPLYLPTVGPGATDAGATIYDPVGRRMFMFGGRSELPDYGGLWAWYEGAQPRWEKLAVPGGPFPNFGTIGMYDALRRRGLFLIGRGSPANVQVPMELWSLALGETLAWSRVPFMGDAPEVASTPAMLHDVVNDELLLVGEVLSRELGYDTVAVWKLPLGVPGAWTLVRTSGMHSSVAQGHGLTLDAIRHRLILFGGAGRDSMPKALSLDPPHQWTSLGQAVGGANRRGDHGMAFDPIAQRVLVFGGALVTGSRSSDVWELQLGDTVVWSPLQPAGQTPGDRAMHYASFDPLSDRMRIVSGKQARGYHPDDVRALSFGRTVRPRLLSRGDVSRVGGSLRVEWTIENPYAGARAFLLRWSADRNWGGLSGARVVVVPGPSSLTVAVEAAVPDTAAPGDVRLTAGLEFAGAPGELASSTAQVFGGNSGSGAVSLSAAAQPDEVRLKWRLPEGDTRPREVARLTSPGAWQLLATREPEADGSVSFVDETVEPGGLYTYALRLAGLTTTAWEGLVNVEVPVRPAFALAPASNPSRDGLVLWATAPGRGEYLLELFDVSGRAVLRRSWYVAEAGRQWLRVNGLAGGGLYWARLSRGGRSVTTRVVVLR